MPSTLPEKKKKKHQEPKAKRKRQDREECTEDNSTEREDKKRQKKNNDEAMEVAETVKAEKPSELPEIGQVDDDHDNENVGDRDADKKEEKLEKEDQGLVAFPKLAQPTGPSKDELKKLEDMSIPEWLSNPTIVSPEKTCELDKVGLSERIVNRCKDLGLVNLFAVQMTVIPVFLRRQALYDTHRPPGDLCISAPTGSGKTLAYVLPIVDILSKRVVTRLRALVVLPTRDLVIQVKETFDAFVKGTDLKVAAVYGQHSFTQEQQMLVGKYQDGYPGGQSRVDILIATPGRLTDHIRETRNFTLQHLRFLVIDEADRLLNQSYNDWLNQILAATRPTLNPNAQSLAFKKDEFGVNEPDAISPAFLSSHYTLPKTDLDMPKVASIQKLLFSATLTKNPAKIAGLHLMNPEYISIQRSTLDGNTPVYTTPAGLREFMTVCSSERKPLTFIYLVHQFNIKSCLCFTKSVESTKRLQMLVEAFEERQTQWPKVTVAEYSSELPMNERKSMLKRFRSGEINILVCSDLIGRGIDLDTVQVVVSYDVPWFMEKYIHRVGRTARAGREGEAYTLVETQEARPFKDMLKNAGHLQQIKNLKVDKAKLENYQAYYDAALSSLE